MLAKCRAGLVDYQVAVSQNVDNFNEGINIAEKSSFFWQKFNIPFGYHLLTISLTIDK